MKINSIQLVRIESPLSGWFLYINDRHIGIFLPKSQELTIPRTSKSRCDVKIEGTVYVLIHGNQADEATAQVLLAALAQIGESQLSE